MAPRLGGIKQIKEIILRLSNEYTVNNKFLLFYSQCLLGAKYEF